MELLPRKLADITSDKVRFSTLVDVHDEMEIDRLGLKYLSHNPRIQLTRTYE